MRKAKTHNKQKLQKEHHNQHPEGHSGDDHIQQMLEIIDTCYVGISYVHCDEANSQARGLGNMVAFWERMRNICPKVNTYHGPIYQKEGEQCVTDLDLDAAMLATRDFWF